MTIEQKRRELFEAWYAKRYGSREHSAWAHAEFCDSWEAWNAAIDAVVIQLPTVDRPSHAGTEWIQVAAQDEYKHRVTAAIESTALGLKVLP